MQNRKTINIIGWTLALLTTTLYTFTMYPTLSFWDSGEFLTTAITLQIGHPPGAPLYQIIGAFFSVFGFGNPVWQTWAVAFISPLAMGLSVALLFWSCVRILNRFSSMQPGNIIASIIGALCFAFADSIWFSATETEVYALATLLALMIFWLVLKWDDTSKNKYLLLAIFLAGAALCVHQLSLLVIPAAVVIVYFHQRRTNYKGLLLYIFIGAVGVVFILKALVPFVLWLLSICGWWAVVAYLFLTFVALFFANRKAKRWIEFALLGLLFFFVGLSVYFIIPLRSAAAPPINSYSPSTFKTLKYYVERDNYSKPPLIYGQYYTAVPPERFEVENGDLKPIFAKEQKTLFPRMWNYESSMYENGYIEWTGVPEDRVEIGGDLREKPSFGQNMRFFFSYQMNYMYFRYLLWNFCGRTNDVQGLGDYKNSQWATGIDPVDEFLGVSTSELNPQARKAHNSYYAIPLLLALVGLFYQAGKDTRQFTVNATLFFFNSFALVLFLNQAAYQPRERDYVYLLSFAAMSVWLAVGVLGVSQMIVNLIKLRRPKYVAPLFFAVPALMLWQNFSDHNHHKQYTAENFAESMLNSCQKNAILFTNGDNDTFPLWYVQQVKKVRQDVRVINLQLLNNGQYIEQLLHSCYTSKPLKLNISAANYINDYQYGQINPSFDTIELSQALKEFTDKENSVSFFGMQLHAFPTNRFFVVKGNDTISWKYDNLDISRSVLAALDIISANINERPIYFSAYSVDDFLGLDDYMRLEGFAYRLSENKYSQREIIQQKAGVIDEDAMLANFKNGFIFRNFDAKNLYYNETEREIVRQYLQYTVCLAYKLIQADRKKDALYVCNSIDRYFPAEQHYYPLVWADMAMLYSLLDEQDKAHTYMRRAVGEFVAEIDIYQGLTDRQQSQQRIETLTLIDQWLRLIAQAEEFDLEDMRVMLADSYFSVINPYLQITFRQVERLFAQPGLYVEEIDKTLEQLNRIYALAQEYEEPICSPPAFLQQLNP